MNLREIYLEIRPEDIAYVKFIVESYEGLGIVRTVLRQACPERSRRAQHGTSSEPPLDLPRGGEPVEPQSYSEHSRTVERNKSIIVLLVVEDFLTVARSLLASLQSEVHLTEIPRPADIGDDWLMNELAVEEKGRKVEGLKG